MQRSILSHVNFLSDHYNAVEVNLFKVSTAVAVWLSGNIVGRINEVTLRRAGLVLRWVTVRWYTVYGT